MIGKGSYAKVVLVKKIVRINLYLGHQTNICTQNFKEKEYRKEKIRRTHSCREKCLNLSSTSFHHKDVLLFPL